MPHFEAFCPRALPFITPDLASLVRVRTRRHGEIPNSVRASGSEKFRLESFIQLGGGVLLRWKVYILQILGSLGIFVPSGPES